jgi:ferredoxin
MADPLILFMPSGRRGRFPEGTTVLEAARQLGVYVESVCGGRGICGRCQIEVQEGQFAKHGITSANDHLSPFGAKEKRYAEKRDLKAGRRLSCSATITGDLVIDIPQDVQINAQIVRKAADTRVFERKPAAQLCYVEVEEPDMHAPLGDLDRLLAALERDWGFSDVLVDQYLYPQVQAILRKGKWGVTAAIYKDEETAQANLIALWPGLHNEAWGIACDIGSTTIAMHLVSLLSGPGDRFGRHIQSADPFRRGSDEPRLLRDDESGRARSDDEGRARGGGRTDRQGLRRIGREPHRHPRRRLRRQSDHASPFPRHRPDRARRARPSRSPSPARSTHGPGNWRSMQIRVAASMLSRASPAMSARTQPPRPSPKARTGRTT